MRQAKWAWVEDVGGCKRVTIYRAYVKRAPNSQLQPAFHHHNPSSMNTGLLWPGVLLKEKPDIWNFFLIWHFLNFFNVDQISCAYKTPVWTFYERRWPWFYPYPYCFVQLVNGIQADVLRQKTLNLIILHISSPLLFEEKLFLPMPKQCSGFRHFSCITH